MGLLKFLSYTEHLLLVITPTNEEKIYYHAETSEDVCKNIQGAMKFHWS
jgi:hypothetical protein